MLNNKNRCKMKIKINWIVLVTILFLALLLIGFLTIKKPEFTYQMTSEEIIEKFLKKSEAISPEQFAEKLNSGEFILIDVRSPSEFIKGHFDNSVNIPFTDLLSEEYSSIFKEERNKLIYAENETVALQAWMILRQIGVKKVFYLKGGYFAARCILQSDSTFNPKKTSDENLLYNFSEINQKTSTIETTNLNNDQKQQKPVKVKARKNQPSGGC